jgi:alanine dehydrogenase
MIIGVPKERKIHEFRVALTPEGTRKLKEHGHTVLVEKSGGEGSGFSDKEYETAGAKIVNAKTTWMVAQLVLKVKEPIKGEFKFLRRGQILFTYLHLAPNPELTNELLKKGVSAIDYATVQLQDGSLPLLRPMSEITGKLAIEIGSELLRNETGILLGGTEKVKPAEVLILGGGTVGTNAAEDALKLGAKVTIFDSNPKRVQWLQSHLQQFVHTKGTDVRSPQLLCLLQNEYALCRALPACDLVIGSALIAGAKAPHLVTEEMVKTMKKGSVIIDVSIDQGGCFETSHPTNHKEPTFIKHGIIHYCVTNMPGSVPRTSTLALTNETLPYILELADKGFERAVHENPALALGVNIHQGKIAHPALAERQNI